MSLKLKIYWLLAGVRVGDFSTAIGSKYWNSGKKVLPYYMINFQRAIEDLPKKNLKVLQCALNFIMKYRQQFTNGLNYMKY